MVPTSRPLSQEKPGCRATSWLGRPLTQWVCRSLSAVEDQNPRRSQERSQPRRLCVPPSWGSLFGGAGPSAHPDCRGQVCGRLAVRTELSPLVTHNLVLFSELIISLPLPGPSRSALPSPAAIPRSPARRAGSDQTARDGQVCGDALETGSSVWGRGRDVGPALSGAERGMSSPALSGAERGPSGPALSGAERRISVLLAGPSAAGFPAGRQPCFSSVSWPLQPMQSVAPGKFAGCGEAVCTTVCQPLQGPRHITCFFRQARLQGAVSPVGRQREDG